jgi:hypothetical protein
VFSQLEIKEIIIHPEDITSQQSTRFIITEKENKKEKK